MATNVPYQRLPSQEVDVANSQASSSLHQNGADAVINAPPAPVVEVIDSVPLHPVGTMVTEHDTAPLPPSYSAAGASSRGTMPVVAPPGYTASSSIVAAEGGDAKLPTYEEYEKLHENDEEFDTNLPEPYIMPAEFSTVPREGVPAVTVVEGYEFALGDDLTFCSTFFVSFFLNWFGFLMTYIFSRTIAGKCGSTSGFGLGLIKLAFYLRAAESPAHHEGGEHSGHGGQQQDTPDQSMTWLVWLLIMFGWFTFVRGITLYIRYKRELAMMQGDLTV